MRPDVDPAMNPGETWDGDGGTGCVDNADLRYTAKLAACICLALLAGFVAGITA